jgi:hypothetical protein
MAGNDVGENSARFPSLDRRADAAECCFGRWATDPTHGVDVAVLGFAPNPAVRHVGHEPRFVAASHQQIGTVGVLVGRGGRRRAIRREPADALDQVLDGQQDGRKPGDGDLLGDGRTHDLQDSRIRDPLQVLTSMQGQ